MTIQQIEQYLMDFWDILGCPDISSNPNYTTESELVRKFLHDNQAEFFKMLAEDTKRLYAASILTIYDNIDNLMREHKKDYFLDYQALIWMDRIRYYYPELNDPRGTDIDKLKPRARERSIVNNPQFIMHMEKAREMGLFDGFRWKSTEAALSLFCAFVCADLDMYRNEKCKRMKWLCFNNVFTNSRGKNVSAKTLAKRWVEYTLFEPDKKWGIIQKIQGVFGDSNAISLSGLKDPNTRL